MRFLEHALPYEIKTGHGRGNDHNPTSATLYHDHGVYFYVPTTTRAQIAVHVRLRVQPRWTGWQEVALIAYIQIGKERLAVLDVQSGFPTGSPLSERVRADFQTQISAQTKELLAELARQVETPRST